MSVTIMKQKGKTVVVVRFESWHRVTRPISRPKSAVSLPAKHYPFDPPDGMGL